jgi:hypothetical protein
VGVGSTRTTGDVGAFDDSPRGLQSRLERLTCGGQLGFNAWGWFWARKRISAISLEEVDRPRAAPRNMVEVNFAYGVAAARPWYLTAR